MKKISLALIAVFLLSSCANDTGSAEQKAKTNIYFVADTPRGFKLFSEKMEFVQTDGLAQEIISDLVSGKLTPKDPEYVNLWGASNRLNSITTADSIATIDLGSISLNVGSEGEQRAIDQIVWTYLDSSPAIETVRFTVNGKVVESFAGHVDTSGDFTRAPSYEVLNPLQISSITEGEVLTNPITISGEACTFEANVVWRLSKDKTILKEEPTTAETACPDRSAWSIALDELAPGSYKLEVLEYSAEDGSLFATDDKNFIVQ
jgi:hypothetical protein